MPLSERPLPVPPLPLEVGPDPLPVCLPLSADALFAELFTPVFPKSLFSLLELSFLLLVLPLATCATAGFPAAQCLYRYV